MLHDVTNPVPKSQPELTRAAMNDAHHVDQAMREISRRLLGKREGADALEERLDANAPGQAKAWALTAQYLSKRLQESANACPGREPDMSPAASAAFRAVLLEVGGMAVAALVDPSTTQWASLQAILSRETASETTQEAARAEAAAKLISSAHRRSPRMRA